MILNADIQAHKLVFQKAFKSLKSKMWRNVGESEFTFEYFLFAKFMLSLQAVFGSKNENIDTQTYQSKSSTSVLNNSSYSIPQTSTGVDRLGKGGLGSEPIQSGTKGGKELFKK